MEDKIGIVDNSGDRKYFTQLPHYILNHSTANDQALYWQMKRYSGETGKCFATQKTLMGKMGIGKKAYDKSLNYLLKRGWIEYVGLTEGKTRPIKTYSIVDIWRLNVLNYDKISAESNISSREISSESDRDKSQKQHKISAESNIEEELYKEEPRRRNKTSSSFKKKPYFQGQEMRMAQGRWWVIPKEGGEWLMFAGKESDIERR